MSQKPKESVCGCIERTLRVRIGRKMTKMPLRLYFPEYIADRGIWRTNVECELLGSGIIVAGRGDDALASLLFALRTIKHIVDSEIRNGRSIYWQFNGDEGGLWGIVFECEKGKEENGGVQC